MITMYIEYVYQIKHHHYVNRFNFIMFNKVYLPLCSQKIAVKREKNLEMKGKAK